MTKKHVSLLVVFVLLFTTLFSSFAFAANDVEWVVADEITIKANYHQQTYGDQEATGKGAITFGKIGESKRLEAIGLSLEGAPADMEIRYGVHAQTYGDLPKDEAKNPILAVGPAVAGTKGEAKRLEGVQIGLYKKGTDDLYPGYQISYQVHMKGYGWGADADNNWYKGNEDAFMADGKFAGTKGLARWIEAVSIVIEKEAKLSVKDVTADNLIQLVVEFNQDVTDNDAVANIENYALEDAKGKKVEDIADVDVDGNFATITLEDAVDNQTKAFLVLNKAILGAEEEIEVRFYDNTAPVAKDAEVIGSNTIKVDFSEPVTTDSLANKEFEVKSADGKTTYGIRSVTPQKNNTEVLIELRKAVEDGDELVLTVSKNNGIQDYFRYKVVATEFELTVEEDNRDIEVVGQKNAKEEGITLVFNKNIKVDDPKNTNFYHTNSRNTVDSDKGAVADGNELKLSFTKNDMPTGLVQIYIDGDALVDYWGNTNAQTIRYEAVIPGDTEAPSIKTITPASGNTVLNVQFSKRLNKASAEDEDNYTIVKASDGKKAVNVYRATLNEGTNTVQLRLADALGSGTYILQVTNVKDSRGNKITDGEKEFPIKLDPLTDDGIKAYKYEREIKDETEYTLLITFDRPMDGSGERYSVDNLANYSLKIGGKLTSLDSLGSDYDVDLEVSEDAKSVDIVIDQDKDSKDVIAWNTIFISRLKDATGVLSEKASHEIPIVTGVENATVDTVKATKVDTVVVALKGGAISDLEPKDFVLQTTSGGAIDVDDVVLSGDGRTVTLTLGKDLTYDAKSGDKGLLLKVTDAKSETRYGGELVIDADVAVKDAIAPVFDVGFNETVGTGEGAVKFEDGYAVTLRDGTRYLKTITLKFTENLDEAAITTESEKASVLASLGLSNSDYEIDKVAGKTLVINVKDEKATKVTIKLANENEYLRDTSDLKNKVATFQVIVDNIGR